MLIEKTVKFVGYLLKTRPQMEKLFVQGNAGQNFFQ